MFCSAIKTKQLAIKQTKRSLIDNSVKAPEDWDDVFVLTLDGVIYEEFYKDYYKDFMAWKKSGGITDVNKLSCFFRSDKKPDLFLLCNN